MAVPIKPSSTDTLHNATSTTIGTTVYIPCLRSGRLKTFTVMVSAAVGTADETFTLSYQPPGVSGFTAVTNGALLIATSGGAAGDQVSVDFTPGSTCAVLKGGTFKIVPTGGGSAGVPVVYSLSVGD